MARPLKKQRTRYHTYIRATITEKKKRYSDGSETEVTELLIITLFPMRYKIEMEDFANPISLPSLSFASNHMANILQLQDEHGNIPKLSVFTNILGRYDWKYVSTKMDPAFGSAGFGPKPNRGSDLGRPG
jgi:hypothetical protein